jgi:DNA-binding response OmpR family regulator
MLLDIGMPGMDGHEVARRARTQSRYDEVMIIALTGWGQEKDRRASREAGIDMHLIKPVDLARLQHLLRTARSSTATHPGDAAGPADGTMTRMPAPSAMPH